MNSLAIQAGQVLFSDDSSDLQYLLVAFSILEKHDHNSKDTDRELRGLVDRCSYLSWNISAKISEAACIRFAGRDIWLKAVVDCLPNFKTFFGEGIILGIFRAAVWHDSVWKSQTEFSNLLPEVIYRFIVANKLNVPTLPNEYENELSMHVKKYVRVQGEAWQKPARLADINFILKKVRQDFNEDRINLDSISPLRTLILDQLLYGLFGDVSTLGRLEAMAYLMNEHFDKLAEKAKAKTR